MSSSKIKYLFGDQLERWHYHSDYLQYVTPDQIGQKLVSLADNEYDLSRLHLWDMFSGIGTDTIKFSNMCRKVTATEIDSKTHSNLKLNLKEFGVSNVDAHLADCTVFAPAGVDLIYFDPPWGDTFESGREFDFKEIRLPNGKSIIELLHEIHKNHKNIIIKSPYDCMTFEIELDKYITRIHAFPKPKLKYIFLSDTIDGY